MASPAFALNVSNDWMLACDVQHRFMQGLDPAPGALDYSAQCRQAQALGGDFYDFLPLPDQRLAVAIGDASGKGVAAALMISGVQSSLRTAAWFRPDDPVAVIEAVNRQVHALSLADRYATLFYGVFDRAGRTFRYVNAGHNPPMIVRRNGSITWLETGGSPVGMFRDWTYCAGTASLNSGDLVIAYTDGVTETINSVGEEWGVDGLRRATTASAAQCAEDIVQAIFASMDKFSQGKQTDDATIAVLRAC